MGELYEIAVKTSLRRLFTYESDEALMPGSRVRIPFRSSEKLGIVWSKTESIPKGLKKVISSVDERPLFNLDTLNFYEFVSKYYGTSLGDLLHYSLPKKVRDGVEIPPPSPKHFVSFLPELSEEQKLVLQNIRVSKGFSSHLLLGETGSGKTEIYLRMMDEVLMEGGQVLMLVPEISLTPQLENRLSERLGTGVSVFHSNLKESIRFNSFASAYHSQPDVFLGARSALFLPFQNLKLIIVDEEHDASYKQNERAPYHARDLAVYRAKLLGIPVVLGSATPSLETYFRAKEGGYQIHRLKKYFEAPKPKLELIDLKKTWETEEKSFISSQLHSAIDDCLRSGEQALIFLNRRGSASQRICTQCGAIDECKHCSSRLTLHFDIQMAVCHLCGFQRPLSKDCEACGSKEFFNGGIGTKELELQLKERFPEARVERLDRDQTQSRNALPKIIEKFSVGKIDILVGTQMISKGIDISKLSLVGLALADQGWSVPDFRAMEKSFQLIHQLIGRAGRRGQQAKILIQSFSPDHPLFHYLLEEKSFEEFAEEELKVREKAELPPYSRLLLINFSHRDQALLNRESLNFRNRLSRVAEKLGIEILGPVASPIWKIKSLYRMQILAKTQDFAKLGLFQSALLDDLERNPLQVRVGFDRDPLVFL